MTPSNPVIPMARFGRTWLLGRNRGPLPSATRPARSRRLLLAELEDRSVPSTLIPVGNRRDLVFDPARDLLYITTSAGTVQRYDVAGQALLPPLAVGTSLNGADILSLIHI